MHLLWKLNNLLESITGLRIEKQSRSFESVRYSLFKKFDVDTTLDIGANEGQWGIQFKKYFPESKIVSYEPQTDAFIKLQQNSKRYLNWSTENFALADTNGQMILNTTSDQGLSSSFLDRKIHLERHPSILNLGEQIVKTKTLSSILSGHETSLFLKLDVQGYESIILKEAVPYLHRASMIEIETSFTPMYENESSHHELIFWLSTVGFVPWALGKPEIDKFGRIWAIDVLLVNSSLSELQ